MSDDKKNPDTLRSSVTGQEIYDIANKAHAAMIEAGADRALAAVVKVDHERNKAQLSLHGALSIRERESLIKDLIGAFPPEGSEHATPMNYLKMREMRIEVAKEAVRLVLVERNHALDPKIDVVYDASGNPMTEVEVRDVADYVADTFNKIFCDVLSDLGIHYVLCVGQPGEGYFSGVKGGNQKYLATIMAKTIGHMDI